jgi:hypothetical protein
MTVQEIINGNELIAEFMGCQLISYPTAIKSPFHGRDIWWSPTSSNGKTRTFWCIKGDEFYLESWDWLMPCIGKISNECEEPEELDRLKYALLTNNIEEAWIFVVDYLKDKKDD